MRLSPVLVGMLLLAVGACRPSLESYAPVLDRFVLPPGRVLADDLAQCRTLAMEPNLSDLLVSEAMFGTGLGGTFGMLAGILFGSPAWGLGIGAAYGAVVGYASGLSQQVARQQDILARCLEGRGYSVLAH